MYVASDIIVTSHNNFFHHQKWKTKINKIRTKIMKKTVQWIKKFYVINMIWKIINRILIVHLNILFNILSNKKDNTEINNIIDIESNLT